MTQLYRLASASAFLSAVVAFVSLVVGGYVPGSRGTAITLLLWSTVVYIVSLILVLYSKDRMPIKHEEM